MIRTLIVDDVELARDAIRIRLQEHKDFEIVGEASTAAEAASLIRKLVPDLVFLDVHMPGQDAFGLLETLDPAQLPAVIFVTAHDKYAVKAFDSYPLHFLLKPIDDERFENAIRRARDEIGAEKIQRGALKGLMNEALPTDRDALKPKSQYLTRLAIKDHDRFLLLQANEVNWIESAANYVEVHSGGRSFLVRMPISDLESRLNPLHFARISRSTIVNIGQVREIKPLWHGDFEVALKDGAALRMSRRYRDRLLSPL